MQTDGSADALTLTSLELGSRGQGPPNTCSVRLADRARQRGGDREWLLAQTRVRRRYMSPLHGYQPWHDPRPLAS